jgi:hypothetical protein
MAEEQLVWAYCQDTVFTFEMAQTRTSSIFGGPIEMAVSGIEHGPLPLHMIVQLAASDLRASGHRDLLDIPLIYGMCYDGCNLEYRVDGIGNIELRRLSPTQSSDDWPYRHFPLLLPYIPLALGATRRSSYDEFAERFPNMPERQSADLLVAVPNPATLGISLWGRSAGDDVTILFECDLADRIVEASNRCD